MDDILISIIGIVLAVILMFIFPLMTMADRTDDISQLTAKVLTNEFVDDIRKNGKIEKDKYNQFIQNLGSTGNIYNIEIEVKVLDENPSRRATQISDTDLGKKVYYSVFNSQIEDTLNKNKEYYLKEGDIVTVSVKNINQTIAQQLKNFFYSVIGEEVYVIAASHGGIVLATGQ
ncbi:MAG: hypothetical protein HFJ60_07215 [Clostridia bacterium]|jgi:hypothetical protein|nr:hypothetical protein [Clostridia bacterium]